MSIMNRIAIVLLESLERTTMARADQREDARNRRRPTFRLAFSALKQP
jgi:hypothetical protein